MDLERYKNTYSVDDAPGWAAIDQALSRLYPGREPDCHHAPPLHQSMGGDDPIDGISIYRRTDPPLHLHYISYGMSELYFDEQVVSDQISKWGFEFTFRLGATESELRSFGKTWPAWPISLMNNLARYVQKSQRWFEHGHFMHANGPIMLGSETKLVGLLFWLDTELGTIDTPHGPVDMIHIVGLTEAEISGLLDQSISARKVAGRLSEMDPLLVTDLSRQTSVV